VAQFDQGPSTLPFLTLSRKSGVEFVSDAVGAGSIPRRPSAPVNSDVCRKYA